jgi:hypothetical protein
MNNDLIAAVLARAEPCHKIFTKVERFLSVEVRNDENAETRNP